MVEAPFLFNARRGAEVVNLLPKAHKQMPGDMTAAGGGASGVGVGMGSCRGRG